jgi:D-amino-acid dehydrogenase
MRIAGFADFTGFATERDQHRIDQLTELARLRAPQAADYSSQAIQSWGGFRPLTPDGRPLIGATPIKGLYLNTGHGSLGWTLACASGEALLESILPAAKSSQRVDRQPPADSLAAVEREIA